MKNSISSMILFLITAAAGDCGEPFLSNIRQLTFCEMGWSKAGEAYFSPNGDAIIFQAVPFEKEHYQMFVMNLTDDEPKMVSTGKGACTCGYFKPDGSKIIFASSHSSPEIPESSTSSGGKYRWDLTPYMNIYEANRDGSSLKALTFGAAYHAECAYSPNGEKIVYASNADGSMNIYVMASDGSDVEQITQTHDCYNGGCFFSPDGKQIIFRADRTSPHYLQIYLVDSDGENEQQLTCNDAVNWAPYWHPDGFHVAFTKSVDDHRGYQIFLLNILTGQETMITTESSFNGLPAFNHDGSRLLWTSKRGGGGSCQIFIADFSLP